MEENLEFFTPKNTEMLKYVIIAVVEFFNTNCPKALFKQLKIRCHIQKVQSFLYISILIHFSDSSIC